MKIVAVLLFPFVLLAAAFAAIEFRKDYWDRRIDALCGIDGGAHVIEKIGITSVQANRLATVGGHIAMTENGLWPGAPAYKEPVREVLRESNPRVLRIEELVFRQAGGEQTGSLVSYTRIGGDIPTGIMHESSHRCPPYPEYYEIQAGFFDVAREE